MLNQQTIEKLYALKLTGMAEALKEQLPQPDIQRLSFEERFGLIVDRQCSWKEDRRLNRYLKEAKLKLDACVEDIDYQTPRGITGATGTGKTFLACAIANKGCREGYRTFYIRSPKLYYELAVSRGDGSYGKMINKLARTQILIIDDLGLAPMTDSERRDLLEVIEDRHGNASTIITSQLPIENWHEHIGDPTIADAILDRLIHNAHKINLKGVSMRKKRSSLT